MTDDAYYFDLLKKEFEQMQHVHDGMPVSGAVFPEPGSSLIGDDQRTDPYHLSHVARLHLSVASDQLKALEKLIMVAARLPAFGAYPLIRSAIENGATALWLLKPASRKERATRRLRLLAAGAGHRANFIAAAPKLTDNSSRQMQLDEFVALGADYGIERKAIVTKATMTDILTEVDTYTNDQLTILAAWQITSGVTHGQEWAIHTLLTHEIKDDTGHVTEANLLAGFDKVSWVLGCATSVIHPAFDLLIQRGTRHTGS